MTRDEIWAQIDSRGGELLDFCGGLVRIPSVNPPGDVSEAVKYLCGFLEKHGIAYRTVGPRADRQNILAEYGAPDESGERTLIFNGHCDVVPVGDLQKWNFDPFSGEIKNGRMLGRGTSDMKCGLCAALFAVALLADSGAALDGRVLFTIVPDEETGGECGTKWLFEQGYIHGRWGVIAEPTGMLNLEIGQKGTVNLNLHATGRTAHGSLAPYVGESAIEKLVRVLPLMYQLREIHGKYTGEVAETMALSKRRCFENQKAPGVENIMDHVTVNIGRIEGGVKRNIVADSAMAELDIRCPIGVNPKTITDRVEQIIASSGVKGVYAAYENPESVRGGNCISAQDPIVKSAKASIKSLFNIEPEATYQWASSDTRYFRETGIAAVQYGPSNTEGIHNYNETVNIADIIAACKVYATMILDLLASNK